MLCEGAGLLGDGSCSGILSGLVGKTVSAGDADAFAGDGCREVLASSSSCLRS